ncbi:hypothetical protein CFRS1_v007309 [Colletotrichum fructicola]|nr:hypothetical protein CFRS1_v007309 [Colletotrichum fructicola]
MANPEFNKPTMPVITGYDHIWRAYHLALLKHLAKGNFGTGTEKERENDEDNTKLIWRGPSGRHRPARMTAAVALCFPLLGYCCHVLPTLVRPQSQCDIAIETAFLPHQRIHMNIRQGAVILLR